MNKRLHGLSFKEKNVKKKKYFFPDANGLQMCVWLFQMGGSLGWGWGARCLTCLQNGMEKLLSATGESTTRGREMRWERWHPSSTHQRGARLTRRNHSHVGRPLNSARGGHTPNCAAGEKPLKVFCLQKLRLLGPERIRLGPFEVSPGPRLPGWQDRLRVPQEEQK